MSSSTLVATSSRGTTATATNNALFCSCKHERHDHALIRCGCSYDAANITDKTSRPVDDAYHRLWCSTCLKFCSKDACCPSALPQLCVTEARGFSLLRLPLKIVTISICILAAVRSWVGGSLFFWMKPAAIDLPTEKSPLLA
ncbi:hypothetical protein FA15DRAFT_387886 [Coprinopsis marcescibilis]|uniref:Uncharacterized protein n=1 Tax=Coprinopsis marcescibilis TaxID=230819 RepID=A0A5C3L9H7_COPMA|nr:hypothetical protein FA15DRAFT_387886 [Coprinopsis marcescibilis]